VAKRMVVSRSPMIPDTVLAAFSRAWVPVLAAFRADSTNEHWREKRKIDQLLFVFDEKFLIAEHRLVFSIDGSSFMILFIKGN